MSDDTLELNPDEFVWSHMKRTGVASTPLREGEKLLEKIDGQLSSIKRMPSLARAFFKLRSKLLLGEDAGVLGAFRVSC